MSDNRLITLKEASDILGITEKNLKSLIKKQKISVYNVGGECWRFYKQDILRLKKDFFCFQNQDVNNADRKLKQSLRNNDFYIFTIIIIIALLVFIYFKFLS